MLLVLSTGISLLACRTMFSIHLFLDVKLLLSEVASSLGADWLIVGIICFDNGVELDCLLACFCGKVFEMRVFFFVGMISFVTILGCDCV